MNASRADDSRRIDWSGLENGLAKLTGQVVRFVGGIRGPRQTEVTKKQILTWFHGTPESFVDEAIGAAVLQSKIRCCVRSLSTHTRANGGHVYVVCEQGEEAGATAPCSGEVDPATIADMPKPDPIQVVSVKVNVSAVWSDTAYKIVRPGARYAVRPEGDARPGAWLPEGEALPLGWTDIYPENEARALLPFLRATSHGRKAAEPTTPDGKLIARACKKFGLTAAALGEKIGAAEAVLSRARNGELPAKHRDAIKALLAPKKSKRKATT